MDSTAADPAAERGELPRASERVALAAEVSLRRSGKLNYRVSMFDLSPEGCKLEFVDRPEIGDPVWVKFGGLEALEAEVCWTAGSKLGLRFARALHPAVFDLVLERLG